MPGPLFGHLPINVQWLVVSKWLICRSHCNEQMFSRICITSQQKLVIAELPAVKATGSAAILGDKRQHVYHQSGRCLGNRSKNAQCKTHGIIREQMICPSTRGFRLCRSQPLITEFAEYLLPKGHLRNHGKFMRAQHKGDWNFAFLATLRFLCAPERLFDSSITIPVS